ncbi:hypothetical protein [Marimonas arenosa]|uniref:Uncharacterized protein n=1 Tax=Marimonas arenosa TaxID=1795305 RepID=A0AAE3WH48_9RHOB|nr:hypothetical protein [Marimonas arenosa]MDQ2091712.1 hypothetical protein [Marimonas arenosa]
MRAVALALLLAAKPGWAFETDYAAVFAAHEADVLVVSPTKRRLELPGPVIIHELRQGDGSLAFYGEDQSGLGAAGCSLRLLVDMVVLAGLCDGLINEADFLLLQSDLAEVAGFVGRNAVPPVPQAELRDRLVARLARRLAEIGEATTVCAGGVHGTQDMAEQLRALLRPAGQAAIKRVISQPRLPVENDCN